MCRSLRYLIEKWRIRNSYFFLISTWSCNSLGKKNNPLLYDNCIHIDADLGPQYTDITIMYGTRSGVLCQFSVKSSSTYITNAPFLSISLLFFLPMKNERKPKMKPKSTGNCPSIYQLILKILIFLKFWN